MVATYYHRRHGSLIGNERSQAASRNKDSEQPNMSGSSLKQMCRDLQAAIEAELSFLPLKNMSSSRTLSQRRAHPHPNFYLSFSLAIRGREKSFPLAMMKKFPIKCNFVSAKYILKIILVGYPTILLSLPYHRRIKARKVYVVHSHPKHSSGTRWHLEHRT